MRKKLQILKDVLGQYRTSSQEHLFICPYCNHHKKKFSINIEKNVYKCWVCDKRSNDVYQVIRRYGSFSHVQEWRSLTSRVELDGFDNIFEEEEEKPEEAIELPNEFRSLANTNTISAQNAMNYLIGRGVTRKDILRWKIGFCDEGEYKGRIIVPSFNLRGKVNFFIARSYDGDWMRYKNPKVDRDIVFNELYVDWDKDVIIVEGVFDAIRAASEGTAIPLNGSTLRVKSKLFQSLVRHGPRVYLGLDENTKMDRKKTSKIAECLMRYGVETYLLSARGYEDIAQMPKNVLRERKKSATTLNTESHLLQKIKSL